jgi:hypothetical protein
MGNNFNQLKLSALAEVAAVETAASAEVATASEESPGAVSQFYRW